jgi:hypothetical protein
VCLLVNERRFQPKYIHPVYKIFNSPTAVKRHKGTITFDETAPRDVIKVAPRKFSTFYVRNFAGTFAQIEIENNCQQPPLFRNLYAFRDALRHKNDFNRITSHNTWCCSNTLKVRSADVNIKINFTYFIAYGKTMLPSNKYLIYFYTVLWHVIVFQRWEKVRDIGILKIIRDQ